jgi:hypothetical protein
VIGGPWQYPEASFRGGKMYVWMTPLEVLKLLTEDNGHRPVGLEETEFELVAGLCFLPA